MEPAVRFDGITKTFGGTVALDSVSFSIERGECHALVGENGAGKSTLGKTLAGIHRPDAGTVLIDGRPRRFQTPRDAREAGISMVHQELAFCPDLTVAENLSLGTYPRLHRVFLDRRAMVRRAEELLRDIAPDIDPRARMNDLSVAQNQLIQIAAAVGTGAHILIFDEPTSALSDAEVARLFARIRGLREKHVTIIYVSHRMGEVFEISDRISVLRDGTYVGTLETRGASQDELVRMMIGRQVEEYFPKHLETPPGKELLRVDGLSSPGRFREVSLTVRCGEIVGVAGLVGSGRSELAQALFGLDRAARGSIVLEGRELSGTSPRARMKAGIALVPEDRKRQGLALILSCRVNFSLTILDLLRRILFLSAEREDRMLEEYFRKLGIRASSYDAQASSLSGGNQQKIVLAKWLARRSRVLILDEPTRGVDVGAKAAIHALIDELASQGLGILLISSELPEVINLSSRILVMRDGRIVASVERRDARSDRLLRLMSGMEQAA